MSTSYRMDISLTKDELLEIMKEINVEEWHTENTSKDSFCISDGENYLWCYADPRGKVSAFCRYGSNDIESFLEHLANQLGTGFYSEHDEEFWGDEDEE